VLSELKALLKLKRIPQRIEAFDISNIGASQAVGSMVLFYNAEADKSGYRRFRIKEVKGIDDYAMLEEILIRRYTREKLPLPDLVLIDGGRGHLSCACAALKRAGLKSLSVISIAKVKEEIFLPERREPLILPETSLALQFIRRIRDEAHRFAITYHKLLRKKTLSYSQLDNIRNIGPKRKTNLIKHFGSLENIKKAKFDDLLKVKGITRKIAEDIIAYFK
jgi:excinuclease ABC subunit C